MTPWDPQLIRRVQAWVKPVRQLYFRAEIEGLDRMPTTPSLIVGNHDGGYIPVDAICFGSFFYESCNFRMPLHVLMHDFPFRVTRPLTRFLYDIGFMPASRRNADRVLSSRRGHLLVFPGGAREAFRTFWRRRELSLGKRTGFVEQALKHRVPLVPLCTAGGHETLLVVARGGWIAKRLPIAKEFRADVAPLWLGLPTGLGFGLLPHIPLPAKIQIRVLEPMRLWELLGSDDYADPAVLARGFELVRERMQAALDDLYSRRRFPIIG